MQFLDRYVSQRNAANTSHARERASARLRRCRCTWRDTIIALDRHGLVTSLKSSLSNFYLAGLLAERASGMKIKESGDPLAPLHLS